MTRALSDIERMQAGEPGTALEGRILKVAAAAGTVHSLRTLIANGRTPADMAARYAARLPGALEEFQRACAEATQ